jgi:NAD(P)-dependent dehydrogenase (short-subunit alcohol dehydrogenase family)
MGLLDLNARFIAVVVAKQVVARFVQLCTDKSGHYELREFLAKLLGPRGIRANGVAPGPIWTPLQISDEHRS